MRRSMDRLLRSAGYQTALFADGRELLQSIAQSPPACVLVDLHMPHMTGTEVLAELARLPAPVPAIVVSGRATALDRQMAKDLGAVTFFPTPFDPDDLLSAIAAVVARRRHSPDTAS